MTNLEGIKTLSRTQFFRLQHDVHCWLLCLTFLTEVTALFPEKCPFHLQSHLRLVSSYIAEQFQGWTQEVNTTCFGSWL